MKLWKNNRIDQEWELSHDEIIARFEASKWSVIDEWPTDRQLRAFLTSDQDGGLSSVFEEDEYATLSNELFDVRRASRARNTQ